MLYTVYRRRKFQSPSIAVSNHGGGVVNIISQIPVSLKLGKTECSAMIQMQKGAYAGC